MVFELSSCRLSEFRSLTPFSFSCIKSWITVPTTDNARSCFATSQTRSTHQPKETAANVVIRNNSLRVSRTILRALWRMTKRRMTDPTSDALRKRLLHLIEILRALLARVARFFVFAGWPSLVAKLGLQEPSTARQSFVPGLHCIRPTG